MLANDLMTQALLYTGSFESDCNWATPLVCVQAEFSTIIQKKKRKATANSPPNFLHSLLIKSPAIFIPFDVLACADSASCFAEGL